MANSRRRHSVSRQMQAEILFPAGLIEVRGGILQEQVEVKTPARIPAGPTARNGCGFDAKAVDDALKGTSFAGCRAAFTRTAFAV